MCFVGGLEGIGEAKGIANQNFVASLAARFGLLCSNPPGSDPSNPCTPTQLQPGPNTDANGVDLTAKKYFPLYPLPNGAIQGNGDSALFTFSGQQIINETFVTTRVDHKFSNRDRLF